MILVLLNVQDVTWLRIGSKVESLMKISEPPLWILLWISSKVFNTAVKLRSVSFLPLISVIMRLFFIFVPWIYAPAFNSIWPISLNRWIFFFFIHACLLCGWFCDPLYVFVWIPFLEGGTNGARWLLRQFLVIHLVPDQIQSSVVALNFIWLDTHTQKKKRGPDSDAIKVNFV